MRVLMPVATNAQRLHAEGELEEDQEHDDDAPAIRDGEACNP